MDVSRLRSALQESRTQLFALIRPLNEEQFRHAPGDGGWPVAAHLAHLLRVERVFVERTQAALREDEPAVASTRVHNDGDPALAQRLAVPQIIHGMQAARRDLEALLDGCDDGALERAVRHETLGRMTVRQMAEKMASHEVEHAEAVAAIIPGLPAVPESLPLIPAQGAR